MTRSSSLAKRIRSALSAAALLAGACVQAAAPMVLATEAGRTAGAAPVPLSEQLSEARMQLQQAIQTRGALNAN